MAEQAVYRRRVLVALDPCEVDPADFEASARLAAGLDAELVALFVEDSDLIAAADLPVTHLIPAGCRQLAALDAAAMRRAFRVAEARAREHLSNAAERWHLDWSFEVTEVRQAAETMARLKRDDFLALASTAGRSCHQHHDQWHDRSTCGPFCALTRESQSSEQQYGRDAGAHGRLGERHIGSIEKQHPAGAEKAVDPGQHGCRKETPPPYDGHRRARE